MADSFSESLRNFAKKVAAAANPGSIPLRELFPPEFMVRNTRTANIDAFLQAGKFDVGDQAAFEALPVADVDAHVRAYTNFKSWEEMKVTAHKEWLQKKSR